MGQQVYSPPAMEKPKSSYKGCLIGCLVAALLMIIAVAALSFFVYTGVRDMIDLVLDDAPMEITRIDATEEEVDAMLDRFEAFVAAAEAGEQQTLELTGRDLNLLIQAKSSGGLDVSQYVYLDIQDSVMSGEISLPMGEVMPDFQWLANKYINGEATFSVDMENNRLSVYIESLVIKGAPAPEEIMAQLRTENMAQDMNRNPEMNEWMQYVESIEIIGDKAVVTSKAQ